MSEEERALFASPLAKQGLHPAYLLGLRPLPWERPDMAQPQDVRDHKHPLEATTQGWPGYELAINPTVPIRYEPPRWPFIPERTVPGYVFEGAEFYKGSSSPPKTKSTLLSWPLKLFASCLGK